MTAAPTPHPEGPFTEAARPAPSPALVEQRRQARLEAEEAVAYAEQRRREEEVRAWKGRMRAGRRQKKANLKLSAANKRAREARLHRERLDKLTEQLYLRASEKAGELEDRRSAVFLERLHGQRPPNDMRGSDFLFARLASGSVRRPAARDDDRLPYPTGNRRVS